MKTVAAVLLLSAPLVASADPHWYQALAPTWWDEKEFANRLNKFTDPVGVDVRKYDGENDPDYGSNVYLYFYVVNVPDAASFVLNISCKGVPKREVYGLLSQSADGQFAALEGAEADPIRKNPKPIITKANAIAWELAPGGGKQAMWLFSENGPIERPYEVRTHGPMMEPAKSGSVLGPSC
jgi:hypothetical protein